MEMPAADETIDNVVAYWTPSDIPQPGQELLFSYRVHWGTTMPSLPLLARVVATRTGRGGVLLHDPGEPKCLGNFTGTRTIVARRSADYERTRLSDGIGPDLARVLDAMARREPID